MNEMGSKKENRCGGRVVSATTIPATTTVMKRIVFIFHLNKRNNF